MNVQTEFLQRCVLTLTRSVELLHESETDSIEYDIYRSASVKEFEIIIEQMGKLLKRALLDYSASRSAIERLNFKDVFRMAAQHEIISLEQAERWFDYRDNRNRTAHDYGVGFAEETLILLPRFIQDTTLLVTQINAL